MNCCKHKLTYLLIKNNNNSNNKYILADYEKKMIKIKKKKKVKSCRPRNIASVSVEQRIEPSINSSLTIFLSQLYVRRVT